jgi:hypothetical protein
MIYCYYRSYRDPNDLRICFVWNKDELLQRQSWEGYEYKYIPVSCINRLFPNRQFYYKEPDSDIQVEFRNGILYEKALQ